MTTVIEYRKREAAVQIDGAVALVTGANRGVGRAFADALIERGAAKVYGAARDVANVTDRRVVAVPLDVTDSDRFGVLARELDDVQLVVNNAGVGHVGFPLNATLETALLELEVNHLSIVSSTQAFAPTLARNGGGAFVNVLSALRFVDTDLTAPLPLAKVPPAAVAAAALDAVETGEPEAIVDEYSRSVKAALADDQRALYPRMEDEFLAMAQ